METSPLGSPTSSGPPVPPVVHRSASNNTPPGKPDHPPHRVKNTSFTRGTPPPPPPIASTDSLPLSTDDYDQITNQSSSNHQVGSPHRPITAPPPPPLLEIPSLESSEGSSSRSGLQLKTASSTPSLNGVLSPTSPSSLSASSLSSATSTLSESSATSTESVASSASLSSAQQSPQSQWAGFDAVMDDDNRSVRSSQSLSSLRSPTELTNSLKSKRAPPMPPPRGSRLSVQSSSMVSLPSPLGSPRGAPPLGAGSRPPASPSGGSGFTRSISSLFSTLGRKSAVKYATSLRPPTQVVRSEPDNAVFFTPGVAPGTPVTRPSIGGPPSSSHSSSSPRASTWSSSNTSTGLSIRSSLSNSPRPASPIRPPSWRGQASPLFNANFWVSPRSASTTTNAPTPALWQRKASVISAGALSDHSTGSMPPGGTFPLRLFFPDGVCIAIRCTTNATTEAVIESLWPRIQTAFPAADIEALYLRGPDGIIMKPSDVVSSSPYIITCTQKGVTPALDVLDDPRAPTRLHSTLEPSSLPSLRSGSIAPSVSSKRLSTNMSRSGTLRSSRSPLTTLAAMMGVGAVFGGRGSTPSSTTAESTSNPPARARSTSSGNASESHGSSTAGRTHGHRRGMPSVYQLPIQVELPDGSSSVLLVSADATLSSLKSLVIGQDSTMDVDEYQFKVAGGDYLFEDTAETPITSLPYISKCRDMHTMPHLALVPATTLSQLDQTIARLVGAPGLMTSDEHEVKKFEEAMETVRRTAEPAMDPLMYPINSTLMSQDLLDPTTYNSVPGRRIQRRSRGSSMSSTSTSGSRSAAEQAAEAARQALSGGAAKETKLLVRLHFPAQQATHAMQVDSSLTVDELLDLVWGKAKMTPLLPPGKSARDVLLKACGKEVYMVGPHRLFDYSNIAECLNRPKDRRIDFTLVSKEIVAESSNSSKGLTTIQEEDDAVAPSTPIAADPTELVASSQPLKPEMDDLGLPTWIPQAKLKNPVRIRVTGVDNLYPTNAEGLVACRVLVGLYHGTEMLCPPMATSWKSLNDAPRWSTWLEYDLKINQLPRAARIFVQLQGRDESKADTRFELDMETTPLGWVVLPVFDYKGALVSGVNGLSLWPGEGLPTGTTVGRRPDESAPILFLSTPSWEVPVMAPPLDAPLPDYPEFHNKRMPPGVSEFFAQVFARDPLIPLTKAEKKLFWDQRRFVSRFPHALAKFLTAVHWNRPELVVESYQLLNKWSTVSPVDALELLDSRIADPRVRALAVSALSHLSVTALADFLPQLVQALKHEPYHDSALARFLLSKALQHRIAIGHSLFWHLKAELHVPQAAERFRLLLKQYLLGCGAHVDELSRQDTMVKELTRIANLVKDLGSASERQTVLREQLTHLNNAFRSPTHQFRLPFDPTLRVKGISLNKCRVMDSKKKPLWVEFENADPTGQPIGVIFKVGDDLRQDVLTLQLLRIMERVWEEVGLDLRLTRYGCIAVADEQGMIEVVPASETTANIQKAASGARAVFNSDVLTNWLSKYNHGEAEMAAAVDNFIHSCAAHCISTYVLGIGDRHNDNIMLTRSGHLLDIDFGHFLGNFKRKLGIRRERAPFVLTSQYAHVMGGRDSAGFNAFVSLACEGYLAIRRQARMFVNLFAMMLSTGIEELQSAEDIDWLRTALALDAPSEAIARERFEKLIYQSLASKATDWNHWAHNVKHK